MTPAIRPFRPEDLDTLVAFGLRAWEPVYEAMRRQVGDEIHYRLHPDWAAEQAAAIRETCTRDDLDVFVAGERPVGFVAIWFNPKTLVGTIEMLAVDPEAQQHGVGTALTEFAFEHMRAGGMTMAFVETGGDPGHLAARRTYEGVGFVALPCVRYFRMLE